MSSTINKNDHQPDICDQFYDELLKEGMVDEDDNYAFADKSVLQITLKRVKELLEGDDDPSDAARRSLIEIGKMVVDDDALRQLGTQVFESVFPGVRDESTKRFMQKLLELDDQEYSEEFAQSSSCEETERTQDKETRLERLRNLTTEELLEQGKTTLGAIHSMKVHQAGAFDVQEGAKALAEIELVLGERLLSADIGKSLGAQFLRAYHACEIEEQSFELQLLKAGDYEELERLRRDYS